MTFDEQMERIHASGYIAILRGDDPGELIRRGIALHEAGCNVLEVTLDSTEPLFVLRELSGLCGDTAMLGVGSVFDPHQELPAAVSAGARFALSPVYPDGYNGICASLGILPVPGASTPDEVWRAYSDGAPLVKLFPANRWNPEALEALPGALGKIPLLPTGGIRPVTVAPWLDAGAFACGIGRALDPSDVGALIEEVRARRG